MHRLLSFQTRKSTAQITSARTLSSHRRPGSPPPELLAEKINLSPAAENSTSVLLITPRTCHAKSLAGQGF